MFVSLLQVDTVFLEADEIDMRSLACIIGQNPDGAVPVQAPLPRLRRLLALSEQFVALVDSAEKVRHLLHCAANMLICL